MIEVKNEMIEVKNDLKANEKSFLDGNITETNLLSKRDQLSKQLSELQDTELLLLARVKGYNFSFMLTFIHPTFSITMGVY